MYLVTNVEQNLKFVDFCLLNQFMHHDASTFEKHGHKASVWYQYDELHVVWMNGPL